MLKGQCGQTAIYQTKNNRARAFLFHCKRWSCPTCSPRKRRQLRAIATAGKPDMLLTLTHDTKQPLTPDEAAQQMTKALTAMFRWMHTRSKTANFGYLWVIERTQRGFPHCHALLRCQFVHHREISAKWKELTGASIIDVQRITSERQAANYVTKYLSKEPHKFDKTRRFGISKSWRQTDTDRTVDAFWQGVPVQTVAYSFSELVAALLSAGMTPEASSKTHITFFYQDPTLTPPTFNSS